MMKRAGAWERKRAKAKPKNSVVTPPTFQYTPKGDVDLFAKFFAAPDRPKDQDTE